MPDAPDKDIAAHVIMTCESGWDVTPRWGFEGFNFVPVDLNSLLYGFEKIWSISHYSLTTTKKSVGKKELNTENHLC